MQERGERIEALVKDDSSSLSWAKGRSKTVMDWGERT